jgi:GNAT superfamily N-acetyltransferase
LFPLKLNLMSTIFYTHILPEDYEQIERIAGWYLSEWNISEETTRSKTIQLNKERNELQVLMYVNNEPVATGGIYTHVGLLEREPRFKVHEHWLALVYTKPEHRGKGYGAQLCKYLLDYAKEEGLNELYLFTHTAESLYRRLGWQETERLALGGKEIVVMKMPLQTS